MARFDVRVVAVTRQQTVVTVEADCKDEADNHVRGMIRNGDFADPTIAWDELHRTVWVDES